MLPYAEFQWLFADLTDYYVGVNSNEVMAGRPRYEAEADYALKTGVDVEYPLSKRFTLMGGVALTHYGNEISESPIVDRSTIWAGKLGLSYLWK